VQDDGSIMGEPTMVSALMNSSLSEDNGLTAGAALYANRVSTQKTTVTPAM
jgi:hypothetical protein